MNAAGLSHQYFAVKSLNTNDNYLNKRRLRDSQKQPLLGDEQKQHEGQAKPEGPVTEPLSRRATTMQESSTPSVTIIQRSLSDSNNPYVVYERESTDKPKYQSSDRGMSVIYY